MAMDFNLSAWALRNRALVLYAMLVLGLLGIFSYQDLGQSEDPPFTFKIMVVRTLWPGATAEEVARQVTDRVEKEVMETGRYEFVRSYSRPGESLVMLMSRDSMVSRELPALWYDVRKKVGDIRHTLPQGVVGPGFNDDFGDTFGLIYAFTADGFTHRELRDYVEQVRSRILNVPDVSKVEIMGAQEEQIFVEFSTKRLAGLGIDRDAVIRAIQAQNSVVPSGSVQTGQEKLGMQTMNQSLATLYFRRQISLETAMSASSMREELQEMINRGVGVVPGAGLSRGPMPAGRPAGR